MIDRRRLATAGVTLAVAFGTGYLMQNGGSVAARLSGPSEKAKPSVSAPVEEAVDEVKAALPELPADIAVPDLGTGRSIIHTRRLAALDSGFQAPVLSDASTPTPFEIACKPVLTANSAPGAMIDVQLTTPCNGNSRITVQHGPLSFADVTDADGNYSVSVPALQKEAKVDVTFEGGDRVSTKALVLTVDGYNRSALVWDGQPGLHVRAFEFGADYGDAGEVWAGAPRSPEHGVQALGGFLTQLGNPDVLNPKLAEVYSFPADRMTKDGVVRMIVEASVTDQTCGKVVVGNTIEVGTDGQMREVALELAMPDCDTAGGFLVLKNLLQDMKIARN